MAKRYALGLDFGTESARALLVDAADGAIAATSVFAYPDGVIDERLPRGGRALPPDWALQNPADWTAAMETIVPDVLRQAGAAKEQVAGVGVDFTSCTILPTTADGTPLCLTDALCAEPHAWPKLWKHHAAQPQADRVNDLAHERGEQFIARYGGRISSEWLIPKALSILEEAPAVYDATDRIIEAGDWIVWQLTGIESRNACGAGYKACWDKAEGYPSADFLSALHPGFGGLVSGKLGNEVIAPGTRVGGLTREWAERIGLRLGTPVAAAIIDAHAGTLGSGVARSGVMAMIMGTSTCHMVMGETSVPVEGISGVVEDGIAPGLFGYEAGQAGVGDIFAWFVERGIPSAYHDEADHRGRDPHELLTEKASALQPGQSGLLALDWWNGCRTPLVDTDLSGAVIGYTLSTKPEEVYRALIEATAYGTRLVIETFERQGVPVDRLVATGGLTKNDMLMQIYADVTDREISVAGTQYASALGAAMLGSTAADGSEGSRDTLAEAVARMTPEPASVYHPRAADLEVYDLLYREYVRLTELFGRGENRIMKMLRRLRV